MKVKAVEKHTGISIDAVIENALSRFDESELTQTRERIDTLWPEKGKVDESMSTDTFPAEFAQVVQRAEQKLESAEADDREEIVDLIESIRDALHSGDLEKAREQRDELDDLLFYLEE